MNCRLAVLFKINPIPTGTRRNEPKVCSEIKETTFWVVHFTTISGHSIANYINIFHKTEVPMVILRCLTSLNLNWIKKDHINYKKINNCVFQFWKKKNWKFKFQKWQCFDYLWSFIGNYIDIFHKTESDTFILRCSVCSNLNWIKSYDIIIG